jgi:hypothetical protein
MGGSFGGAGGACGRQAASLTSHLLRLAGGKAALGSPGLRLRQGAHGPRGQHHAVKLLFDEFRGPAAKDDLTAAHVGFELVKGHFDLPVLRIEGGQLLNGLFFAIGQGCDQAVERLGSLDALDSIFDHPHDEPAALLAFFLLGGIDPGEERAVGQNFLHGKVRVRASTPQQRGSKNLDGNY